MSKQIYAIAILLLLMLMVGCSGQAASKSVAAANPTPTPITPGVKGKVTPRQFVELGINSPGVVAEVPVREGQRIQAGQVLVRLDDARLKLAVEEARLKLQQAQLDFQQAQKSADPADLAAAEKAVQAAQVTLVNARGAYSTTVEHAQSNSRSAELALEKAQRDHDKLLEYQRLGFDVEDSLRTSQVNLDNLRTNLEMARLDAAGAGIRASQSIVEAQQALAAAQAKYAALKRQPEPEEVKAAQLAVESAQLARARAEANLKNATLAAPIAGTVAEALVKAGQQVAPGTTLISLADTSAWVIETDDLTELTVVDVKEGGQVTVQFDAIPGLQLPGHVERIALRSQDKRGDVTYTVRVVLDKTDPRLRWNMTALVQLEK